jgi:hypothetical protein
MVKLREHGADKELDFHHYADAGRVWESLHILGDVPASVLSVGVVMRVVRYVATVLSVTAVLLGIAAPVTRAAATEYRIPYDAGLLNPCNNEIVHMTTVLQVVGMGDVNSDHQIFQLFIMGKGSDDLGNSYTIHNTSTDSVMRPNSGSLTETAQQSVGVISAGSAPNFTVDFLFHLTIDANGNLTSFIYTSTTECRG